VFKPYIEGILADIKREEERERKNKELYEANLEEFRRVYSPGKKENSTVNLITKEG
jgi:hypothetical protein